MNESHLLLPDLHKNGLWEVTADQALFRKKTVIDQNMAPKKDFTCYRINHRCRNVHLLIGNCEIWVKKSCMNSNFVFGI